MAKGNPPFSIHQENKLLMALLERKVDADKWFYSDLNFDQLYPVAIQQLARMHWTPLDVARKAANFLAIKPNVKILDIGSGVGKFCLGAAYYKPDAFYYGTEQRKNLVYQADAVKEMLGFENVAFFHSNFTQLDLRDYDHFYFYNSFYENLAGTDKIDNSINYSGELYDYYSRYLCNQLEGMPAGTRLVTFHSLDDEIPHGYQRVDSGVDDLLKFWIKK
ncbi:methyltransferase domain-containing protein [Terrimonas alba]|uniref:methyltransferase domain-containing protein n=1 Tax=Terrimonas alba TaxID=3349636 RepID=UPI0035F34723